MTAHPVRRITIAATFTAEPIVEPLGLWLETLGLVADVDFAPYNQVVPQLLDPAGVFERNRDGVHVLLVRTEDWRRLHASIAGGAELAAYLNRSAEDLVHAVRTGLARRSTPIILAFCPGSEVNIGDPDRVACRVVEQVITDELAQEPGILVIPSNGFEDLEPTSIYDPERDQLGHIPYTPYFFSGLATAIARRIHAISSPPRKVVVLDCDNTLWRGVVGEDGTSSVEITTPYRRIQEFLVNLARKGFVLCLASKNQEDDVLRVFEERSDMVLKREHLVTWRINWQPKSQNIQDLARELNLGLDSFVFLDDNPVECAEVKAGCPGVLVLRLPLEEDFGGFLERIWAFDRFMTTAEDLKRTAMYQQEAERTRFKNRAVSIEDFLAGLELKITITPPTEKQVARTSQLTQRTNQFNFTTVRRSEGEIRRLNEEGLECRVIEVSDRFGEYGLVGVVIFGARRDQLEIDTMLLSCRVLGRGVEHRMIRALGTIALERGLGRVIAPFRPSAKNQPARDFLETTAHQWRQDIEDGSSRYEIPAEAAANLAYIASTAGAEVLEDRPASARTAPAEPEDLSERYESIARMRSPIQVLEALAKRSRIRRPRPDDLGDYIPPRNEAESIMAALWAELIRVEPIGVHDSYFELGGTSLQSVELCAQIRQYFGKALPLTAVLEAPTVALLTRLATTEQVRETLILIRPGGDRPPLFLVHDGDGETMLYRNLAFELDPAHPVYGLQPFALPGLPLAHTRIEQMADYHIAKIRKVQGSGPYLIGGMCAGGVIAFEIARRLHKLGEKVALVALLDAADPAAELRPLREARRRMERFAGVFKEGLSDRLDRKLIATAAKITRKVKNTASYLVLERVNQVRDRVRMKRLQSLLDRELLPPEALRGLSVRTVYLFAEANYRPEQPYDGILTLFRATAGEGNDEPYLERYADPELGWRRRTSVGVETIDVPGGHSSMLQPPHVSVLASALQVAIKRGLGTLDERPSEAEFAKPHARSMLCQLAGEPVAE